MTLGGVCCAIHGVGHHPLQSHRGGERERSKGIIQQLSVSRFFVFCFFPLSIRMYNTVLPSQSPSLSLTVTFYRFILHLPSFYACCSFDKELKKMPQVSSFLWGCWLLSPMVCPVHSQCSLSWQSQLKLRSWNVYMFGTLNAQCWVLEL